MKKEIASRLEEERLKLGKKKGEMAEIGGVANSTYTTYLTGQYVPDANFLSAIAAAGADVLYILTGVRNVRQKSYEITEPPANYGMLAKKRLEKIFEDLPDYQKEEVIKTAEEKRRLNRCEHELEELKKRVG